MSLLAAVTEGNPQKVYQLCTAGANLLGIDEDGNSALHLAAMHKQASSAQVLLLKGADKLLQNNAGKTPMQVALASGSSDIAAMIDDFEPSGAVLSEVVGKLDEHIVKRFDAIEKRLDVLARK
eukprot:TRINITY_DN14376_c0_g1_i1.p2 TRINITY_DN14376_c0_g1~~TRINITY_DN14376_c0_g1_i1.p2  ORF type:complete len:123 (+),score=32.77 TRINITY_DN14376_c0_g1_i1:140-508(+)